MATKQSHRLARWMMAPSVFVLLIWMIVPLALTIWFAFQRYRLTNPNIKGFAGLSNFEFFVTDPAFWPAIINTLLIVVGVLVITVGLGILLALMLDQPIWGQGIVRILMISPFFVMPPVAAVVWKHELMNPTWGVFAAISRFFGAEPVNWLGNYPLLSIIVIVAWQWLPFATLILLTAMQSLSEEQKEAAEMDGANVFRRFWYIILPHLARAITVVILIQTIYLLGVYAEIQITTGGGPGFASTNLPFLIYNTGVLGGNIGAGAAGGLVAVVLANIVAIFLMRAVGRNLDA
ncbi:MAG: sugar ABC transporter permease [Devosia sp.]|jgi:sorbitol/mannitol transport system permease protein|nr:sugar ABC transporter permease [Devosia sp.]